MTRITVKIVLFMMLINGGATIMEGSGLADDLGVTLAPGVESAMDDLVSNAKDGFDADAGLGDTLFALFASGMDLFKVLGSAVFAAPSMFRNLGFPNWIVGPVFAPMYLVVVFEFVYMATGRDALGQ